MKFLDVIPSPIYTPEPAWYQSPLVWALVTVLVAAAVTLILRARKKKK